MSLVSKELNPISYGWGGGGGGGGVLGPHHQIFKCHSETFKIKFQNLFLPLGHILTGV